MTIHRNLTWTSQIHTVAGSVQVGNVQMQINGQNLVSSNKHLANVGPLFEIANVLASTLYIGPFRNTINVGTQTDYLDIQIGEAFIKQFRALKTGPSKARSTGIQKLTEDIQRIFEFDSPDIIPSADDSSLHITVNGNHTNSMSLVRGWLNSLWFLQMQR